MTQNELLLALFDIWGNMLSPAATPLPGVSHSQTSQTQIPVFTLSFSFISLDSHSYMKAAWFISSSSWQEGDCIYHKVLNYSFKITHSLFLTHTHNSSIQCAPHLLSIRLVFHPSCFPEELFSLIIATTPYEVFALMKSLLLNTTLDSKCVIKRRNPNFPLMPASFACRSKAEKSGDIWTRKTNICYRWWRPMRREAWHTGRLVKRNGKYRESCF